MNTYICTCATWICVTCVFIEYVHVAYLYIHVGDHSPPDVAVDAGNHLGETQPQHFTDLGRGFPPGQLSLATTLSCRPNCVNKQGTSSNGGICVQNVRETYFNIIYEYNWIYTYCKWSFCKCQYRQHYGLLLSAQETKPEAAKRSKGPASKGKSHPLHPIVWLNDLKSHQSSRTLWTFIKQYETMWDHLRNQPLAFRKRFFWKNSPNLNWVSGSAGFAGGITKVLLFCPLPGRQRRCETLREIIGPKCLGFSKRDTKIVLLVVEFTNDHGNKKSLLSKWRDDCTICNESKSILHRN